MAVPSNRPLSPHLSIYKPQMTSGLSIFHKATWVALAGGLVFFVAWVACLAIGTPDSHAAYDWSLAVYTSTIGKIYLIGWTWVLFYHIACGVRYLFWAAGRGLSLKCIYTSGTIALVVSFAGTIGLWVIILWGYVK